MANSLAELKRIGLPAVPAIGTTALLLPLAGLAWALTGSKALAVLIAAFVCAAWVWPQAVLAVLIVTAPLARSGSAAVLSPAEIAAAKTIAALLFGAVWLLRRSVVAPSSTLPPWMGVWLGAWGGLNLLSLLHGSDPLRSLEYLGLSASGLALFLAAWNLGKPMRRYILMMTLAIAAAAAALVLLQYAIVSFDVALFLEPYLVEPRTQAHFASNLSPLSRGHFRPSGIMSHPNPMGLYFAFLLPFACAVLGARGFGRRRWLLVPGIVLMIGALYVTNSRAAAMWALVALAVLSLRSGYRWLIGWTVGIAVVFAIFLTLSPAREAVVSDLVKKARMEHGLSGRPMVWKNALDLARQSPFLGVGPGNFTHDYVAHFGFFLPNDANEQASQIWSLQMLGDQMIDNFHAHNIYLQLTGELGVAGPLLFLLAVIGVIVSGQRLARRSRTGTLRRALTLAVVANAVGLLLYGFFDSQLGFTVGSLNLLAGPLLAFGLSRPGRGERYA